MGLKKDLVNVQTILVTAMQAKDVDGCKQGIARGKTALTTALNTYQAKKKKKIIPLLNKLYDDLDAFRTWLELEKWRGDSGAVVTARGYVDKAIKTATTAALEEKKN